MSASVPISDRGTGLASASAVPASTERKRHSALVRVTHWLTTLAFLALLVTGGEIVLSHPRFYWGETGNVNMRPWLNLHVPSSRGTIPTGYGYVLPDQNGWSRYLHFQAAWLAVATGLLYVLWGLFKGHFRRNVCPAASDLSPKQLGASMVQHLRFARPAAHEAWSYNVLQRITYLRALSFDDLDGARDVVRVPICISAGSSASRRSTDGAVITFSGDDIARAVRDRSRGHDFCCWIPSPHARHDHRKNDHWKNDQRPR
jgi:thiosulfate reductase cytochrome b subunit